MSNALKYSGDAPEVTVQVVAENDIVTITVSDQGPGIPESFRDRLFTKFAQETPPTRANKVAQAWVWPSPSCWLSKWAAKLHTVRELPMGQTLTFVFTP